MGNSRITTGATLVLREILIFLRGKSLKFTEDDWLTETDAVTELKLIEDLVRGESGEAGLTVFKQRAEAYFEHEHLALRRLVEEGIISQDAYE